MDHPPFLTRAMVADVLSAWGSGRPSNEDIHLWALDNYLPAAQEVAPGEPSHTGLAIGTILTEFECAGPPFTHFNPAGWRAALSFMDTSIAEYRANEVAFFKECFGHELGPPAGWRLDRYRELGILFE
jgi:hypothetical protein